MLKVFYEVIHTGLDILTPIKKVRVNTSDAPWITQHLKPLIMKRQKAFHKLGIASLQYKLYRNLVNRERNLCKGKFYKLKVEKIKDEDPKVWWRDVKRLSGAYQYSGDLISKIHVDEVHDLYFQDLANAINKAFLYPLEEYRLDKPLARLPNDEAPSESPEAAELRIYKLLSKINPSKTNGPDEIPNWLLREYADFLALHVCKITNASIKEQRLPRMLLANVSPLPKKKIINDINKDLRPISLTSCISKVAEDCVI